ncbi:ribosome maturation factor RimM [Lichenifustis flavocetrariae]|uniref:Ribosome maturation factor RimM n=1 Tax=Lichenifustis flavocetrariae TaxID=2949735 RepID=A0AA41YTS3_9HYPH|nr:ribosome maturation factor RimM [Lichenifustis flavocetrariae]MCW6508436.1 ribosome maturation factor RimM [Lichenifustis flavocetrariae]
MTQPNRILVGVIGAPHGVRGEVRVKSYTHQPMSLADYPALWTGDGRRCLKVAAARLLKDDMLVVRFEGLVDRDAAQLLTNMQLLVARDDLPPPDADEFYHADLVGLRAEDDKGLDVGRVVSLQNFGAGDLLEIAPASAETFFVPFTRAFVPVVDIAGGRVVLAEGALSEDPDTDADMPGEP